MVRIGERTALPARAPDAVRERPYTGGWLEILDVVSITAENTIFTVNMSASEEEARGVGRPASQGIPAFVADPAWAGGKMNVYPKVGRPSPTNSPPPINRPNPRPLGHRTRGSATSQVLLQ